MPEIVQGHSRHRRSRYHTELLESGYSLGKLIGEGGMGRVFAAVQLSMGRRAAVKTLKSSFISNTLLVERFLREARVTARLANRNIVRVFDCGTTSSGVPYYVMELLDGETLACKIKREGALSPVEALEAVLAVADGLVDAHSYHVVHRDVKPRNVFVVDGPGPIGDRIRLIDFGVAKLGAWDASSRIALTQPGVAVGSYAFMAPEQAIDASTADERADVFGIGATLYTLAAGKPPFGRDPNPFTRGPRDPLACEPLEAAVSKCLAWDPNERPATMEAAIKTLRAALGEVREAA